MARRGGSLNDGQCGDAVLSVLVQTHHEDANKAVRDAATCPDADDLEAFVPLRVLDDLRVKGGHLVEYTRVESIGVLGSTKLGCAVKRMDSLMCTRGWCVAE